MTTGSKILIAGAVVGGVFVAYKFATAKTTAPRTTTGPASNKANGAGTVGGFLDLTSSIVGYFSKNSSQSPAVNGTRDAYESSGASEAYAYEAGGVLPSDATAADFDNGNVVYGPFL